MESKPSFEKLIGKHIISISVAVAILLFLCSAPYIYGLKSSVSDAEKSAHTSLLEAMGYVYEDIDYKKSNGRFYSYLRLEQFYTVEQLKTETALERDLTRNLKEKGYAISCENQYSDKDEKRLVDRLCIVTWG